VINTNIEWTDSLKMRFWSYVDIREPNECWPWKGGTFARGYGQFRAGKKKVRANRCAYELVKGPLGELNSLHECDNPPCCNPAHLFKGSLSDNSIDRHRKGRAGPFVLRPMRGEENPAAKLCVGQVLEIRAMKQAGLPQRKIAQIFSLSQSQVGNIVRGESWAEIQA
jgi:hypothetical protein